MADQAEPAARGSRTRSRSMVLLLLGVLSLTPPLAVVFDLDYKIFGVPFTLVYLMTVWALLILGARWLAGPLRALAEKQDDT